LAFKEKDTVNREDATNFIRNGNIFFTFYTPYDLMGHEGVAKHLKKHEVGVKDIALLVDDSAGIFNKDVKRCAIAVK
jgi:hypothetical protein